MLRGNIICIALAALLGTSSAGQCGESADPLPDAARAVPRVLVQATSCASECQTQHDRCRVQTKGSPSCDAERQRCLEICLQRKRR